MAKEFQGPADPVKEPAQTDMGASKIDYGSNRPLGYVEPGSEGAKAVSLQVGNGGIGSQSSEGSASDDK